MMGKQNEKINITAVERDGMRVRILTIQLQYLEAGIDILRAVKDACTEYVQTDEGQAVYRYNCESFNWADFVSNVPNEICEKHGFCRINDDISEIEVNWDEHLVDDDALEEPDQE